MCRLFRRFDVSRVIVLTDPGGGLCCTITLQIMKSTIGIRVSCEEESKVRRCTLTL